MRSHAFLDIENFSQIVQNQDMAPPKKYIQSIYILKREVKNMPGNQVQSTIDK
jgi:hypothetical protein